MKITSFQLEQQSKQKLNSLYLLCGEDPFLLQESLELLRQKAATAGYLDRLRLDIENDADLELAYNQAYTPPLFNQKRFLELNWKNKPSKSAQQFLIDYGKSPGRHTLMVVRLGKIDARSEQTQWFKSLEKNAVYVPHWPLPQAQLAGWLIQRAKNKEMQLSPDAAQLLAHYVEGNLQAASQEIEKLSILGESKIDRSMVETFVSDQGCFNAFDLVDHSLAGNSPQVLRILRYLQQEGSEPLMILGAFMHELRTLCKLAKELAKGSSIPALMNQYRVRISRQNQVASFLKRNTEQNCYDLVLKAGEIDRIVKGAQAGNSWEALQIFSLAVASGSGRPLNKHI